jgi:hypothetical protein
VTKLEQLRNGLGEGGVERLANEGGIEGGQH